MCAVYISLQQHLPEIVVLLLILLFILDITFPVSVLAYSIIQLLTLHSEQLWHCQMVLFLRAIPDYFGAIEVF